MPASLDQQWTPEEDNTIRALVKAGSQLKDMPPHLPRRTLRGIQCRAYTLGLKSGQPRTKHSKNEAFWAVPNALNSYYAGLLAADGSVGGEREVLQWTCESTDRPAMEAFVKATSFTGKIVDSLRKSPCSDNVSVHCRVSVSACQQWNADLARVFNVVPQKTNRLAPPLVNADFLRCCYLIGYTDGDGCIHVGKNGVAHISYVSASREIMQWVRDFVDTRFPFKLRQTSPQVAPTDDHYYRCSIYGLQAIRLFEFLRAIDVPKFARKWDNPAFLQLAQAYRAKWPEEFAADKEISFDATGQIVATKSLLVA